jgi:hypothetical protein
MCKEPTCKGVAFSFSINNQRYVMCTFNYDKHKPYRRELEDVYFRKLIKESLEQPDFIYKDLNLQKKGRFCYYKKQYQVGHRSIYIKTIINILECPIAIITAYKDDFIKESKFAQPICNPLNTQ